MRSKIFRFLYTLLIKFLTGISVLLVLGLGLILAFGFIEGIGAIAHHFGMPAPHDSVNVNLDCGAGIVGAITVLAILGHLATDIISGFISFIKDTWKKS